MNMQRNNPKVSIVVIFKAPNNYLMECLEKCLRLDYDNFEILLFSDTPFDYKHEKVRIAITGSLTPAKKRNLAISIAEGEIIAFIDDDAYPVKDWLKNAVKLFENLRIAAVCGPGSTLSTDNIRQRISGFIYESFLASGNYTYRYLPMKERFVDDYPTFNFIVRKSALEAIGGFKSNFWPGEDTLLCLDIIRDLKMKILYNPNILVYHHRRPVFKKHLRQVANYALHRGYFAKRFPGNSLKFSYFIPSIFTCMLFFGGILSYFLPPIAPFYLLFISAYISICSAVTITQHYKHYLLIPAIISGIISTHIIYGIFFLKGLFSKRLKEE